MLKKYRILFFAIFGLVFSQQCFSQVQLSISFGKATYIQHEGIDITLELTNDSGTQLAFGKTTGKIEFLVLNELNNFSTRVSPYKKGFNPAEGLLLGAGESKILTIRLNKYYPLAKALNYRVKAIITHPAMNNAIRTKNFEDFTVISGNVIETKIFGVTDINNPKKVKSRKYDILGFNIANNSMYCMKIYDDKWVYALHRLGPRVRGIHVQHQVDTFSNIHVLIQLQPQIFMHTIFSPSGTKQQEVLYRASFKNVPRLIRDTNLGKVTVLDGLRAEEGVDYIRQGNKFRLLK
ncbi:MAG: hypothetical protein HRT88_04050 [Lentisphaeraceae bacterium]|nr:hypothetical protein [Lentisphaeraceae bacterium]